MSCIQERKHTACTNVWLLSSCSCWIFKNVLNKLKSILQV